MKKSEIAFAGLAGLMSAIACLQSCLANSTAKEANTFAKQSLSDAEKYRMQDYSDEQYSEIDSIHLDAEMDCEFILFMGLRKDCENPDASVGEIRRAQMRARLFRWLQLSLVDERASSKLKETALVYLNVTSICAHGLTFEKRWTKELQQIILDKCLPGHKMMARAPSTVTVLETSTVTVLETSNEILSPAARTNALKEKVTHGYYLKPTLQDRHPWLNE